MAHQCFVMMPSGNHGEYHLGQAEADFIYDHIIKPAVANVYGTTMKVFREVDNRTPGAINTELIEHIAHSDLTIVDITGQNPNVFLELGVRYALRENTTLLMRQEDTEIPFNIANLRCISYSPHFNEAEQARKDLISYLEDISNQSPKRDSLVFDAIPHLYVSLPLKDQLSRSHGLTLMPWQAYWERLQAMVNKVADLHTDGRFVPSAIVGITNGGAMFADLLAREAFPGRPVVALWADRHNPDGNFFENPLNEGILKGLKDITSNHEGQPIILLVDDILASGTTHKRAVAFIRERFPEARILFLPLFSRNDQYFVLIGKDLLWNDPLFGVSDQEARGMHSTNWHVLPYGKDLRSA